MEMKFSGLKNGRLSIFLIGLIFLQIIANANAVPVTKDETEPIAKPVDSVDLKENKEVEKTIVAPITEHGDKVVAEVKTEHSIDSDITTTEKMTTTTTTTMPEITNVEPEVTTVEPEMTTVEPEVTTIEAMTDEPVVEKKKKVMKTTVEVEPEVLETPKKTTTVTEVEEEEETTTIRPKVVKTTTEQTAEVEPEPVVKKVVKPATKEIKKTSKKAKFIEICTGSLQSPWFCNLDDFAEDKRCSHVYSLKWTYEREKELLEIKFRYQPFGEEKVALGLVNVQAVNGWFAVKKEHSLFDDFLYWNEEDDTTEITRLTKNYFRIRQTVRPDQIKCSGIGFFIYTTNEHNDTLNYHFHASSRSEVCPSTCSICLSKPDMGIPCTVEPESRFYFNKRYGRCVEFIYSGCGGNQNNFLTLEACHSRCAPHLLEEQKSVKKSTKKAKEEEEEEEEDEEEEKEKKKSKKKTSKKSRRSVVDEPIDDEFSTPAKIPKTDRTRELKKPIADQKVVLPKVRTFTPTQPRQIKKLVGDEKIEVSTPVEKKVVEHDHSIESHTVRTTPKTTTESIDEEEETTTVKPITTTTTKRTTTEVPEIDDDVEATTKKFVATTEPTTTTHHTIVSTTTERETTTVKPVIKFSTTTPENEEDEVDFVTTSTVRPKVSVEKDEEEIVRSTTATTTTTRPTTTTTTTTEEIEETTTTTTERPTTTSTTTTTTTEKPTTTSTTTTTTTTTTEKPTTTTTTTTEPTTTTTTTTTTEKPTTTTTTEKPTTTTTTEKPTTTTSTTTTTEPTTTTTEKPTTTTTTTERVPVTTTTERVIEEEVETTTTKRPITTTTTTTTEEDEIVITTTVPVTTEMPTTTTILNKIKESIAKDIETTTVEVIRSTTPVSRVDEDVEETTLPTTTSTTTTTTTTTARTTTTDKMLEDLSNQIKFEVTNYTSIDNNEDSTETKSYSLRLHIKGYKWNERFHDVNSTEAKEFMRSKILPLLYKYLNVTPDELNEVKLLRLFKGSVQSDITVKSNATSNLNSVISTAMKFKADRENTPEVEKSAIQIINDELNAMQKNANCTNFYTNYSMIVIAEKTLFTPSFNESLMGLLKNAILKFYAPSIDDVEIEIADYKCLNKSVAIRVKDKFSKPMSVRSYTLSFEAKIKLTPSYIKSAIETASIGRIDCNSEKRHEFIPYCSLMSKNSSYLIRMSDFWIDLENPDIPATAKLIEEMQLFTYKPAWIIGLAVIGCILAIFFVGCLIAICYTRRPYKRAGKIYELDTNNRNQIPQIPGMYPSTKTSTLPKAKELHY